MEFNDSNTKFTKIPDDLNHLAGIIIGLAIKVHKALGPGLLESSYLECLFYEIKKAGYKVQKEMKLPLIYEEVNLDVGYRIDIMVDEKLILEIKSVESLADIHSAQTLTYLKLSGVRLGLLMNFNVAHLVKGVKRLVI